MNVEDALRVADEAIFAYLGRRLTDRESALLRGTLMGQSYKQIAITFGYSESYIKRDASYKWQLLSQALGETVTKKNFRAALERYLQKAEGHRGSGELPDTPSQNYQDWGEAVDVSVFYGRTAELALLTEWLTAEQCRLVTLLGMGGIGKTSLSVKLAQLIQDQFEYLIWRSLRNAPPIENLLAQLLPLLSNTPLSELPSTLEGQISQLMECLRSRRCLLILDNVESILRSGERVGVYREGYQGYGELFRLIGEVPHQSVLILTSRELPEEVASLEGEMLPVRTLRMAGLTSAEGEEILKAKGLQGQTEAQRKLVECYRGNPLALKIVSTSIRELFDGNVAEFLEQGTAIFNGLRNLLSRQFNRLSELEKQLMYWLAINREPVTVAELREDMVPSTSTPKILETLESLLRRSLIEQSAGKFTQQPVVMEYTTDHLIEQVCEELASWQVEKLSIPVSTLDIANQPTLEQSQQAINLPMIQAMDSYHQPRMALKNLDPNVPLQNLQLFKNYALLKGQAKDYVREAQICLILKPITEELLRRFGTKKNLETQLMQILTAQREQMPLEPGYVGGNVLNLFNQLGTDLTGCDFSQLTIWQADLRGVNLHRVNFTHSDLTNSVFTQTFGCILSVAFSPDGQQLAIGNDQGEVRLWQVTDSQPLLTCRGHTNWIWSVAWSPDGKTLASASEDTSVKLWDGQTGQCLKTLQGHTNSALCVVFSPNGQTLASSSKDYTVRLWDIHTGDCLKIFQGHSNWIEAIALSPQGNLLASAGADQTLRLWDVYTGDCLKICQGHTDALLFTAFSPDGETVASSSADQTVRLWNVHTGQVLQVLHGHTNWVCSVRFSPDGQTLASGSSDQTVKVWDVNTGQCLKTLEGHTSLIWSVSFSPDGQTLATGSLDQTVKLWNVNTGQSLRTLQGYTNHIWSVSFSPDGQLLASGGRDQVVRLWDVPRGKCVKALWGHTSEVKSVSFSPQGNILISRSTDQTVKLWDVEPGQCLHTLQEYPNWPLLLDFNQEYATLNSGHDDWVKLGDLRIGRYLKTLEGYTSAIRTVAFSPNGQRIVGGHHDQTVKIWDVQTGQCLKTLLGHTHSLNSVAFSPDGQLIVSGGNDQTARLWNVSTGECLTILRGHTTWVYCLAFSPNSQLIASGSNDQTIRLWDVATGQCLRTLQGHTNALQSVAFSPEGQILASSSIDETIKLWDLHTGKCLRTLTTEGPYEGMMISNVKGLTEVTIATLKALGAVENI